MTVREHLCHSFYLIKIGYTTARANKKGGSEIVDFSGTLIPMVLKFWHNVFMLMHDVCTKFQVSKFSSSLMNLNSCFSAISSFLNCIFSRFPVTSFTLHAGYVILGTTKGILDLLKSCLQDFVTSWLRFLMLAWRSHDACCYQSVFALSSFHSQGFEILMSRLTVY